MTLLQASSRGAIRPGRLLWIAPPFPGEKRGREYFDRDLFCIIASFFFVSYRGSESAKDMLVLARVISIKNCVKKGSHPDGRHRRKNQRNRTVPTTRVKSSAHSSLLLSLLNIPMCYHSYSSRKRRWRSDSRPSHILQDAGLKTEGRSPSRRGQPITFLTNATRYLIATNEA